MPLNVPNLLTWLRIVSIPLVVVLFYLPYHWSDPAAGALFAIAGITDTLDGYYARKLGQTSRLGKAKTIMQIVGLSMMLIRWDVWILPTYRVGLLLTLLAAALTLVSMVDYLRAAWPDLRRAS